MPGTTSTAMPAARQAAISSPARPKIIGSPPLSRTTRLPALGERHHQRVDLVLLAGGRKAGLADQHLLGLAAGEIEDAGRDQIVDQDHVGRLQRAHRAQRQQFGIAGAGADQRDRAVLDGRALRARRGKDQASKSDCAGSRSGCVTACAVNCCQNLRRAGERQAGRFHGVAPAPRRLRPAREAARDHAPRAWRGSPARTPARRRRSRCR